MKKTILSICTVLLFVGGLVSQPWTAQAATPISKEETEKRAEIKFDSLKIDMGTFSERDGVQYCTFTFTNIGDAPLILNQAFASCGCTVPTYTKDPIKPGEKGKIEVTYNGKGKFTGHFSKTITVRSNAKTELVRLTREGVMTK